MTELEYNHLFSVCTGRPGTEEASCFGGECTAKLRRLIEQCWHQDPHERPRARQAADIIQQLQSALEMPVVEDDHDMDKPLL